MQPHVPHEQSGHDDVPVSVSLLPPLRWRRACLPRTEAWIFVVAASTSSPPPSLTGNPAFTPATGSATMMCLYPCRCSTSLLADVVLACHTEAWIFVRSFHLVPTTLTHRQPGFSSLRWIGHDDVPVSVSLLPPHSHADVVLACHALRPGSSSPASHLVPTTLTHRQPGFSSLRLDRPR